jgi:hypothetical protein
MALGPTSRALEDQGPEARSVVATSIRRALQRDKRVALAVAVCQRVAPECSRRRIGRQARY